MIIKLQNLILFLLEYSNKVHMKRHSQPILFACDFRVHVWNKNVLKNVFIKATCEQ